MATFADRYPKKIVCLTEEPVETLYLLNESKRIAGVSVFVERPAQAKREKPIVSAFTHANLDKIIAIKPDLVLGHSDIQKDIAKELIAAGIDVWISNHRSLEQVLDYIVRLGSLVGRQSEAMSMVEKYQMKMEQIQQRFSKRPSAVRVYLEEWDEPMICGIRWFSELVELFGVEDIFAKKSQTGAMAKERFVDWKEVVAADPHFILACWCGKKVDFESIKKRKDISEISAFKLGQIKELQPSLFLQPGPALFEGGIDVLERVLAI